MPALTEAATGDHAVSCPDGGWKRRDVFQCFVIAAEGGIEESLDVREIFRRASPVDQGPESGAMRLQAHPRLFVYEWGFLHARRAHESSRR